MMQKRSLVCLDVHTESVDIMDKYYVSLLLESLSSSRVVNNLEVSASIC